MEGGLYGGGAVWRGAVWRGEHRVSVWSHPELLSASEVPLVSHRGNFNPSLLPSMCRGRERRCPLGFVNGGGGPSAGASEPGFGFGNARVWGANGDGSSAHFLQAPLLRGLLPAPTPPQR